MPPKTDLNLLWQVALIQLQLILLLKTINIHLFLMPAQNLFSQDLLFQKTQKLFQEVSVLMVLILI
ncbi:hypothetical protein D3C80_1197870 [compost metagenome]